MIITASNFVFEADFLFYRTNADRIFSNVRLIFSPNMKQENQAKKENEK